jgi:hypothetical protein
MTADQAALFDPEQTEENAQLRDDLKHVHAELTALNNRYMILLKEQTAYQRSVRAAASKSAWETVAFQYAYYLVAKMKEPFGALCGRIEMLPDKAKPDQIERLKWHAQDVRKELAEHDNDTSGMVAENRRLRAAVQEQAGLLHKRFGYEADRSALSPSGRCECPGCELVRSLDDVPPPPEGGTAEVTS